MISKIKSDKGASITVALLLFLVCAVIGAVVLTAGTATSGRMSNLAEMDQRYYSVTSAAELLIKELNSQSVTIERTKVVTVTTKFHCTIDSQTDAVTRTAVPVDDSISFKTVVNGGTPIEGTGSGEPVSSVSFLTGRAVKLLFGTNNCNTDAAMGYTVAAGGSSDAGTFVIEHTPGASAGDISGAALKVYVSYEMKTDGTLVFKLSNTDDESSKNRYVVVLTMNAAVEEGANTEKVTGTPVVSYEANGSEYYETTVNTTTDTKTTKITWTVGGMEVG